MSYLHPLIHHSHHLEKLGDEYKLDIFSNNLENLIHKTLADAWNLQHNPDTWLLHNKLYKMERRISSKKGRMIIYDTSTTWHRDCSINMGSRRVISMIFNRVDCKFTNWMQGFWKHDFENLFCKINPYQRTILGLPLPGDPYWDKDKLDMLVDRFGIKFNIFQYSKL